jgi:hypothetical protein
MSFVSIAKNKMIPKRIKPFVRRINNLTFNSETFKLLKASIIYAFYWPLIKSGRIQDINRFEQRIYSQNGEDGIIRILFETIGTTNRFCVEFGTEDGRETNTRYLITKEKWGYLHMDGGEHVNPCTDIKREYITAENINDLFSKYQVPKEFDLLSIDLDYNTYWIWKALSGEYRPRVLIIEYNSHIPVSESKVVRYDAGRMWDGTSYYGGSLLAMVNLGKAKGYTLIGCDSKGVNAFFIRNDVLNDVLVVRDIKDLYKEPRFGNPGHPISQEEFQTVDL